MNTNNTSASADNQICLDIKGLNSYFFTPNQLIKAVRDVDLTIPHGKTVAMVGNQAAENP